MVTKSSLPAPTQPGPEQPHDATGPLGQAAAHNVWLAGLGALANAQAEGSKAFEALVKQGLDMQTRAQDLARERMQAMADPAATGAPWNRLGGIFEERVARALASMGMPSAQDLAALTARVEALEQALGKTGASPPSARAPARKTTTQGQRR